MEISYGCHIPADLELYIRDSFKKERRFVFALDEKFYDFAGPLTGGPYRAFVNKKKIEKLIRTPDDVFELIKKENYEN